MNKTDKLSFSERIMLTHRAYNTIKKYCPGLMQTVLVKSLVTALQPFATIWFSAQILNELAGEKSLQRILIFASAVVFINFIISIIKGRIEIMHGERVNQMWSYFGKVFADKQLSMDYVNIEDVNVQKRKDKEKFNLFNFGNGLAQFVWTINSTIEGIVSVIASIAMVVTLFTTTSGNTAIDTPLWIAIILLIILMGLYVNTKVYKRNNDIFMDWSDRSEPFHRLYGFFGFILCKDNDRAKDARIYRQDIPADTELFKHEQRNKSDRYYFKYNVNEGLATFVAGLNSVICYSFVALKSFFGAFGVGGVVQYVGALGRLGDGLQKLIYGITDNRIYCIHLKNLFEFLDIPNEKYQGTLPVEKRVFCDGGDNDYEVEFKNVSFKYPNTECYALKNLNLKLYIGKKLAVVGMNGSGKTTMIKLLCRLYDPTEGEILLNGIDIKKYDYSEYMSIFSVVFQDFKLFSFSLGQNVSASVAYDSERVEASLKKAGFGERLAAMPKGIETCLYKDFEEDGVEISGGEAQKIALARALYKNAPFIVLDEPTAALDPIAEYEIYSKFNDIVEDKTAIYISHRLSSCRFCDDIAVFHEGELIQRGSHTALISDEKGKYYELWNAQAQYYQEDKAV